MNYMSDGESWSDMNCRVAAVKLLTFQDIAKNKKPAVQKRTATKRTTKKVTKKRK